MKKNIKGITLVSLVITIIVMLILAGVSISMATGNNGVLSRGQQASKRTNIGAIQEDLTLAVTSVQSDYEAEWAMDSTFASRKRTYCTPNKLNKYLTKCKVLVSNTDADNDKAAYTDKTIGTNIEFKGANTTSKISVWPGNTALSQIAGVTGTNVSSSAAATDCGRDLSVIFLGTGTDGTKLGNALYAALYYMDNGMPTFVDVGLISAEIDGTTVTAKSGTIAIKNAAETVKAGTGNISGISDNSLITWMNGKECTKCGSTLIPGGTD